MWLTKLLNGLSWTKPAHFISATLIISNNIMPTTLTQTITCFKPSPSLPSNQKLKLNYYSLLLFKNPRRWTIHSSTKTLPSKQAICSMRCTVAMQKESCRPRRTRKRRVQGLFQITWLASWLWMSFIKLMSILKRNNTLRQRQRRHKRMPGLPGKRSSRSGNKMKICVLH